MDSENTKNVDKTDELINSLVHVTDTELIGYLSSIEEDTVTGYSRVLIEPVHPDKYLKYELVELFIQANELEAQVLH